MDVQNNNVMLVRTRLEDVGDAQDAEVGALLQPVQIHVMHTAGEEERDMRHTFKF
jgi:hypothetical protein